MVCYLECEILLNGGEEAPTSKMKGEEYGYLT